MEPADEDVPHTRGAGLAHAIGLTDDRLEMDYLLVDLEQSQQRILDLELVIRVHCGQNNRTHLLCSMPGNSYFTATLLAFAKAHHPAHSDRSLIQVSESGYVSGRFH